MPEHRELLCEQLVELHALPCGKGAAPEGRRVDSRKRVMKRFHRFAKGAQPEPIRRLLRQRIVELGTRQSGLDQASQRGLSETRRRRIDRRQRRWERSFPAQHVKSRMSHLAAEEAGTYLTEHAHGGARRERLCLTSVEIEKPQHQLA